MYIKATDLAKMAKKIEKLSKELEKMAFGSSEENDTILLYDASMHLDTAVRYINKVINK